MLYARFAASRIRESLRDTPVVALTGPRQSGKTTLARQFASKTRRYLNLDDAGTLAAARHDPVGFINDIDRAVIDEIQRAPELMLAIKQSVDEDRRAGRFLLTGSANLQTLPTNRESLAGRIESLELYPLSQAELRRAARPTFLTAAFAGRAPRGVAPITTNQLIGSVTSGGYPEVIARKTDKRRLDWCRAYLSAIVERDIPDVAALDKLARFPRLLEVTAHLAGQLVNLSEIARQVSLDYKTIDHYLSVLERLYLVRRIAPWHRNELKRLVKTPKLHFIDTGLLTALRHQHAVRLRDERALFGPVLESFVFGELLKISSCTSEPIHFFHYRDKEQLEVDFVLENTLGEVVGIEVKAAASVQAADFRGLERLREACGREFKQGIVLYNGDNLLSFGTQQRAAPMASLWS